MARTLNYNCMKIRKINAQPTQLDDETLVRRIMAGERELFELFVRRNNQTLYRVIRSYVKVQAEVEDIMQNTYLKAFDKLFQFKAESAFSTWLIRIGINEALLRLKNMKKENVIYFKPEGAEVDTINSIPDKQNPEELIIRHESHRLLEQAIDQLPERYRVVYVLKEIEGLTNQQVTESLGLTDSNIKVRLHRAKTMLKESLLKLSATREVYEFGNTRCDAMVNLVMRAIG